MRPVVHLLAVAALAMCVESINAQQTTAPVSMTRIPDAVILAGPAATQISGHAADRMKANIEGRLLTIDENILLEGFRHRPGKHPWIGEHVGKWLHASSMAYLNSRDPRLREKMDRVAGELVKTQEADGYIGTYIPQERMGMHGRNVWDVWVHKYCIIGLLSYADCTGSTQAVECAQKAGDYLLKVFPPDGSKDINETSIHAGMASGSIVEPLVLLSRATGEMKYIDFAEQVVAAWERPTGSKLVSNLLKDKSVLTVGNRKAYEMLSCLVGLCELYRATGRAEYLAVARIAQEDVAQNHMLITGSGSADERWTENRRLLYHPEDKVAETCVTVTWMQLNTHLFELTGEPKYIDELERTIFNHLLGAQRPSGAEFCYYTPLVGKKPYEKTLTCCFSSGARGVAMIPDAVYSRSNGAARAQINLFLDSRAILPMGAGQHLELRQETQLMESDGTVSGIQARITVTKASQRGVTMQIRIPDWAENARWRTGEEDWKPVENRPWHDVEKLWRAGEFVELQFPAKPKLVRGSQNTEGMAAVVAGPRVFSADLKHNPTMDHSTLTSAVLSLKSNPAVKIAREGSDAQLFSEVSLHTPLQGTDVLKLVPYSEAGSDGSHIATWFQTAP